MRLQFLLSLVTLATAVVGAPPHVRHADDALEARSPGDLDSIPYIQKRDSAVAPREVSPFPRATDTDGSS